MPPPPPFIITIIKSETFFLLKGRGRGSLDAPFRMHPRPLHVLPCHAGQNPSKRGPRHGRGGYTTRKAAGKRLKHLHASYPVEP